MNESSSHEPFSPKGQFAIADGLVVAGAVAVFLAYGAYLAALRTKDKAKGE